MSAYPQSFKSPIHGPIIITSPFNAWRDYDGDGIYTDRHAGIDFLGRDEFDVPAVVLSVAVGEVVWVSNRWRGLGIISPYGNHIIVEHGNGLVSTYAHMSIMIVEVGDVVYAGQALGVAGTTGRSTGVHLHYMLQYIDRGLSGYPVPDIIDPTFFFDF